MVLTSKELSWAKHVGGGIPSETPSEYKVAVIGVGGTGNSILNRLDGASTGIECIAIDTDMARLDFVHTEKKILIGERIAKGLGVSNQPYLGREAILESVNSIERLISGLDVVFIVAHIGGGTGAGAAPIIAEMARGSGATVVAIVILPSGGDMERFENALCGVRQMRGAAHTTILFEESASPASEAADNYTQFDEYNLPAVMIKDIIEGLMLPSTVKLDLSDFKALMSKGDVALAGVGISSSKSRAEDAMREALNRIPDERTGATGALVHVVGGSDMALGEAIGVAESVAEILGKEAMVVLGTCTDPNMKDGVKVSLLLTGLKSSKITEDWMLPEIQLYNLEPLAGPESALELELDLFQMESDSL